MNLLVAVKDVTFVKCLLNNGKKEEAEKVIQEIRGACSVEEKGELLYLIVWSKLMMEKSDFEAEIKELKDLDENWFIKANILQNR